jgi:hypothetical protein
VFDADYVELEEKMNLLMDNRYPNKLFSAPHTKKEISYLLEFFLINYPIGNKQSIT